MPSPLPLGPILRPPPEEKPEDRGSPDTRKEGNEPRGAEPTSTRGAAAHVCGQGRPRTQPPRQDPGESPLPPTPPLIVQYPVSERELGRESRKVEIK